MTDAADTSKTHPEERTSYYSWVEDYLEGLEGRQAFRDLQELYPDTPEYHALVASLMA